MPESTDRVIETLDKNSSQRIEVALRNYKGRRLIDIRVFYLDRDGQYKPSRSGVALDAAQITALRKAIQTAEREIKDGDEASPQEPKVRHRRTKAEMEAARVAGES